MASIQTRADGLQNSLHFWNFWGLKQLKLQMSLNLLDLRKLCKRLSKSFVFFIILCVFFCTCPTPRRFKSYKIIYNVLSKFKCCRYDRLIIETPWPGCFWSLCNVVSCASWQAMRSAMWEERCLTIASTNPFLSWFVISHLRASLLIHVHSIFQKPTRIRTAFRAVLTCLDRFFGEMVRTLNPKSNWSHFLCEDKS